MQAVLSHQLAAALRRRLFSEETIERIVQELTALGVLNDEEWTASFVRFQSRRKMGPRAIAQKLASKGVRGESLDKAVEEARLGGDQKETILQLLETRYCKRNLSDPKERKKVIASLVRRGFDLPLIFSTLTKSRYE